MRQLLAGASAVALAVAIPHAAVAQPTVPPTIYCVPGATHACFAMAMAADGPSVTFWLQNLQGTYASDPTPFTIGAMRVERVSEEVQYVWTVDEPGGGGVTSEGVVGKNGFDWGFAEDGDAGVDAHQMRLYTTEVSIVGLAGCSDPFSNPGDVFLGWTTCVRDGETGWVRIDFRAFMTPAFDRPGHGTFLREATLADVDLWIGSSNLEVGCTIPGANSGAPLAGLPACLTAPYELTPVPEPATLALVGGGLLLVGGIAATRRRRT